MPNSYSCKGSKLALDKGFTVFSRVPNTDTISYKELMDGVWSGGRRYISGFKDAKPKLIFLERDHNMVCKQGKRQRHRDVFLQDALSVVFAWMSSRFSECSSLTLGGLTHCCA